MKVSIAFILFFLSCTAIANDSIEKVIYGSEDPAARVTLIERELSNRSWFSHPSFYKWISFLATSNDQTAQAVLEHIFDNYKNSNAASPWQIRALVSQMMAVQTQQPRQITDPVLNFIFNPNNLRFWIQHPESSLWFDRLSRIGYGPAVIKLTASKEGLRFISELKQINISLYAISKLRSDDLLRKQSFNRVLPLLRENSLFLAYMNTNTLSVDSIRSRQREIRFFNWHTTYSESKEPTALVCKKIL